MAVTTLKKARLGKEDLYLDTDGTQEVVSVPKSDGTTRLVKKINAVHIPTTTATRAKTDAAGTTLTETDVDSTLQQLLDDNVLQGIPDGTTVEVSSGTLQVKANGIGTTQLAADSVTENELREDASVDANRAVKTDHIKDSAVTTAKINASAVTEAKIGALAVTEGKIGAGAVTTAKLGDDAVTSAKTDMDGSGNGLGFFCIAAGTHSLTGGATTEIKTISISAPQSAVGTGDILIVSPKSGFTQAINLVNATISNTNEITYDTETGNIPAGAVVYYAVFKACS